MWYCFRVLLLKYIYIYIYEILIINSVIQQPVQSFMHLKRFQMTNSKQFLLSAVSSLFASATGRLPGASWGHCIWVTVPLQVTGRSSSCWGPHVTVAVVLGSSRVLDFDCSNVDNSRPKTLESKTWGEGEREKETTEGSSWRKRGRESQRWVSNLVWWWLQCQELNKRFIGFWGSDLFCCCEFLSHE